jgi:hypothetical protein
MAMRFVAPKREEDSKKRGMKRKMKIRKRFPTLGTCKVLCIEFPPCDPIYWIFDPTSRTLIGMAIQIEGSQGKRKS